MIYDAANRVLPAWTKRRSEVTRTMANGTEITFRLMPPEDSLRVLVAHEWESRPRALVSSRTMAPLELEGCAEGHKGVMCSQCKDGYFRNPLGKCIECPSDDADGGILRLLSKVAIVLVITAALCFLLVRAWRQQSMTDG